MKPFRRITLAVLLALCCSTLSWGQNAPKDSVFRLVQAQRAEQYEKYGQNYRLVQGHARFLHNDTYLLCDSASWNVDAKYIEAYGNVQIIQNKTMLKSEEMMYWIDESRAVFRGPMVELFDKDGNRLRTSKLTYNTKDSVAVFEFGGALKDKDGNVIESARGTYDGKESLFTFEERVEIYMDTIEMKTQTLRYFTEEERAYFGKNTYAWKDEGFLRADGGSYDRGQHIVRFSDHVFLFDPTYDAWADEVVYDQLTGAADLYQNAQVLDTANKSIFLGDHLQYAPATDSLTDRGLLTGDPAIIYYGENENHVVDTLYVRADTFYVYAIPRSDIPAAELKEAQKRIEDIRYDALSKKREEDAAAQEQERIKKMREVGKLPPEWVEKAQKATADSLAALSRLDSLVTAGAVDSLVAASDSLRASRQAVDSLLKVGFDYISAQEAAASGSDSTSGKPGSDSSAVTPAVKADPPRDTTPVRYVHAWNHVKLFRSDLQAVCDSIVFTEVDSVARLYGSPALWNEIRNQLTAEEMHLLLHDGALERGSMITNAWLISEQDTVHYNQIKSTEMQGWFRDNKLFRFDALGGVSAIFYMAEDEVITTINVKESKSLTAALKDNKAQRLLYVDAIKSDVYPVGELEPSKQRLKDFKWRGDERPDSPQQITRRKVRQTERPQYEGMRRPLYRETNKFFDNYMLELFEKIDAEKKAEYERRQAEQDSLARVAELAQLQAARDSIVAAEAALTLRDSVAVIALSDSTRVVPGDTTHIMPADSALVMPGVTGHPDTDTLDMQRVLLPETDAVRPPRPQRDTADRHVAPGATGDLAPASPETVVHTEQLSRAEKRAMRRAERLARREARKAARAARRAAREAARIARQAAKTEKN
jgi:lipopolysaccharide export system protein LptA